jgi:hypothetical protein
MSRARSLARLRWQRLANLGGQAFLSWLLGRMRECPGDDRRFSVSSAVETRTISVGQGREVCLEMAGDPQGNPVLVHNGTPNSRHLYGRCIADAAEKGIYLISYDRPGYGGQCPCFRDIRPGQAQVLRYSA